MRGDLKEVKAEGGEGAEGDGGEDDGYKVMGEVGEGKVRNALKEVEEVE